MKACVVGAGPNGLAAAITLAQAGIEVDVFEAEPQPGGAVRTLELTLPGYLHDFGSAVFAMAAGSPFFQSLPLLERGLDWIHSPLALAHPFDDGSSAVLHRDIQQTAVGLGKDGNSWRNLMQPFAERWPEFAKDALKPIPSIPHHPFLMARFGLYAMRSARSFANSHFREAHTKALFAGLAAHSFLSLDELFSAAAGVMLAVAAHAVGWPIARGGAGSITTALCDLLVQHGSRIHTSDRVESLSTLSEFDLCLCDVTPGHLVAMSGDRLSAAYRSSLARYKRGPGVFKIDYALSEPIPWKARDCASAATVHVGGTFEEIAQSESNMRSGVFSERPYVIVVQPSLFDSTRAPVGKHTAWAYCHVPVGSTFDMQAQIENQIDRFAPGFRECVLARKVLSPSNLEKMDANLAGGDISGGAMDFRQFVLRPTWRHYATSDPSIYLCSSSTPPGGGVHGMCGYHAAASALKKFSAKA